MNTGVAWPLQLVLSPTALQRYNSVAAFLFRLRRVVLELQLAWLLLCKADVVEVEWATFQVSFTHGYSLYPPESTANCTHYRTTLSHLLEFFTKLMAKPFAVMRATDAMTKGMMGRLYDSMLQLTEDVDDILDKHSAGYLTRAEVKEIRLIVKDRWDKSLACPLHVVGRILNPANQEEGIFRNDVECTRVLKAYIAKHYDSLTITDSDGEERRASLVLQEELTAYLTLQGSFGLPTAIEDRAAMKAGKMTAVQWWNWHGTDAPHLATCAICNLSQPVSASPYERNWSMWDAVHTARRNRLGSEKCRDLVYIAHNWQVVHNWYKVPEGQGVVNDNIPEAPLPEGYNMEEDGEEEDMVLEDEYA
ncbi:unnamed protein product [Closterium sp. Naga37s-1]|nr:unnamed protein product [Closterium sp. Naga37s-1]